MITNINIDNLKCLEDHNIPIRPLTILAGGNGAGKSTAIQSILLMKRASEIEQLQRHEVELNGPYMLQLGLASGLLSTHASSDRIKLSLVADDTNVDFVEFGIDVDRSPSALQVMDKKLDYYFANCSFRYLNAERVGPRRASEMNTTMELEVGNQGEYSIYAMHQANILKRGVHQELQDPRIPTHLFSAHVEAWLQTIIPEIQFTIKDYPDLSMMTLGYKNSSDVEYHIPTATGFGITYVLPIIVAGLLASQETNPILVIENPEAHLHPLGQSRIGKFLAVLSTIGITVIVETHSEHVINGARLQLATTNLTDNLVVNFFSTDEGKVVVKPIYSNVLGELSAWPIGFFDQQQRDLRDLLRLKMR